MSNIGRVGFKYTVKPEQYEAWMMQYGVGRDSILELVHIDSYGCHTYETPTGQSICLHDFRIQWYDEKSAMREIPKADNGTRPNLLAVDESWLLPAGTFFRVNGKHTPLYLVMSNSHVFNLTEKQMHTTCSSRFKNAQLSVANVQLSEVL